MLKIILGPPGTGKTTKLIEVCKDAIQQGVDPQKIGFISFTRQATEQAIQRAGSFSERGLPYFRTIHSLAFRQVGYSSQQVFGRKHFAKFSNAHGYEFTSGNIIGEDGAFIGRTEDDKVFHLIGLSRVKFEPLQKTYDEIQKIIPLDVSMGYVAAMAKNYETYKEVNRLVDFNDMICNYAKIEMEGKYPQLDLLCVDEAQDLSSVQWEIVKTLTRKCQENYDSQIVYAGDDDQAIYEWSGADIVEFQRVIGFTRLTEVLHQTHRFGDSIHAFAGHIIQRCKVRTPKEYVFADKPSFVHRINQFDEMILDTGTWLILARNFYLLRDLVEWLSEGQANAWDYINNKKSRARIRIGTIHSAKGAEADNVVLLTDMSRTTYDNVNSDAETRVWYVAATRARNNLYILEPQGDYYYDI